MKKQSRLAVLLAAVLACAMLFTGVAFAMATELNANREDVEAALSAEEVQAQIAAAALYEKVVRCDNLSDFLIAMLSDEEALMAMNKEQLDGLLNRAAELYAAIENPTGADNMDYADITDTIQIVKEMNGMLTESAYPMIAAAGSLEEMWAIMSAEENAEGLDALTYFEIEELRHKANGYYCHLEFPTESETYFYSNIEETLNWLVYNKNQNDIAVYADWSGNYDGRTVYNTLNINLTGNVKLNGQISIYGTVNVTTSGNYSITRSSGNNFFKVYDGGTLNITGSNGNIITIKNGDGSTPTIDLVGGTLKLDYVKISNCKNDSAANSWGGAISFSNAAGGTINHTTIENCVAGNGSALYFGSSSSGTITVKNSTITGCTATTGEYDGTIRTMGGSNCKLTIESCTIKNNTSGLNGGGVYWNARGTSASLTITGTSDKPTVIEDNYADNGGGIFLSGSAITISNTKIVGNRAKDGGGICMQPYDVSGTSSGPGCTLTLNAGAQLLNNTASNFGGGVYMEIDGGSTTDNENFRIYINDGAVIEGNKAPNGGGIAITQTTGNAEYTSGANRKYNSYVYISGGRISGNEATTGNGGAVYIDRKNYGNAVRYLDVQISGGEIYGNKALNGNGGAIYVSTDTASQYAKVTVSGGTVGGNDAVPNEALNGGAIYLNNGNFEMTGGTVSKNTATTNGGAVYVTGGTFTMNGGTMSSNSAPYGGAAYVNNGSFTLQNGSMISNTASTNGGAAYVNNGTFTMNGGSMSSNTAPNGNGGAAYVNGGDFNMYGGILGGSGIGNSALNGGAVYVIGGNFNMISGTMSHNVAIEKTSGAAEAGTEGYGGAVYAAKSGSTGGAVVIGVEGCVGTGDTHTTAYTTFTHPVVNNNEAEFGGGFAVNGGSVAFYCGQVLNNKTDSDGTGKNVFMQDGAIVHYLNEAVIGDETNHGMVSTGGTLTVHFKEDGTNKHFTVQLIYNSNYNEGTNFDILWEGEAPSGYYLNLPYCPQAWQEHQKPKQLRFVGWTGTPVNINSSTIRSTDDYNPVGDPVEIRDMTENDDENIMRFYAVWAPETSDIHYAYVVDGENIVSPLNHNGAETYNYTINESSVNIGEPVMPGYTFQKWILYAEYGTDFTDNDTATNDVNISNWGSDAECVTDGKYVPMLYSEIDGDTLISSVSEKLTKNTLTTLQNFGNITLVAIFEPAYTDLTITKTGTISELDNPSFIFHVVATELLDEALAERDYDMYVVIDGTGSVTIQDLPVGKYTVTEQENWSWRYSAGNDKVQNVTLSDPARTEEITFTNTRDKIQWLDGETIETNVFN